MKALSKREWTSWFRWSVLIFVIHATILGLVYDWNIFSFYEKSIILFKSAEDVIFDLPQVWVIQNYIPRIFDATLLPIFSLFFLLLYKKVKNNKELISGLVFGLVFGLGVGLVSGLVSGLGFGLGFGLVVGLVVGLVFVFKLLKIFFKKNFWKNIFDWFNAKEFE